MKRLFWIFPLTFFVSCGFLNPGKEKIPEKPPSFNSGVGKEYYKTLYTKCNLTVKDALLYEYSLTGDESYLEKLETLPPECRNLKISEDGFLVSNLPQKEELCFPGIEFKSGKERLVETLNKRVNEVLEKHFCY